MAVDGRALSVKDPTTYTWPTYLWVFGLALLGGLVSFMRKLRDGHARYFNFAELIGELTTSAFAGIITFWLCEWAEFSPLMTAACVGIAGHMGSRALFLIEQILSNRVGVTPSVTGGLEGGRDGGRSPEPGRAEP